MIQPSLFETFAEMTKPVPSDFFNTIHISGSELAESKAQTGLQDHRVLEIYQKSRKLTPLEAWEAYSSLFPVCPLTSIRRSITVLTGRGLLRKTDEKRMGKYGKVNYVWEVV